VSPSAKERWILHADMDAFFASVEQRDHPELQGKPVIVGGTSNRGVVSAASYEARLYGVRSAMPTFKAKALCPDGVFVRGDMRKYAQTSREIHEVFEQFTSDIEPLALDEAFLDISGSLKLLGPPLEIGKKLKQKVYEKTRLRVSVGLAPNKLVAKIACGLGKPDGLKMVTPDEVRAVLGPLPIRKLWGVGPKTEDTLKRLGVHTFEDLAIASARVLEQVFGRFGEEMRDRARGNDTRPVETERAPKSIGEEATFGEDIRDLERLSEALVVHAEAVAARARRAGYVGQVVTIKLKMGRRKSGRPQNAYDLFESKSRQRRLRAPTSEGRVIFETARRLLEEIYTGDGVRLVGLSLSGLLERDEAVFETSDSPREQLDFQFSADDSTHPRPYPGGTSETQRSRPELGAVLDQINDKFGSGTLRRAVEAQEKLSPHDKLKVGEE
jgi:DNA polymerase IV